VYYLLAGEDVSSSTKTGEEAETVAAEEDAGKFRFTAYLLSSFSTFCFSLDDILHIKQFAFCNFSNLVHYFPFHTWNALGDVTDFHTGH